MNIELLRKARAIIEAIPGNVVDLSVISNDCGTICCGAGWLAQDPEFKALGLSLVKRGDTGTYLGGRLAFRGEESYYESAMANLFDTDEETAMDLFGARGDSDYDVDKYGWPLSILSDKHLLLHRFDRFLEEHAS